MNQASNNETVMEDEVAVQLREKARDSLSFAERLGKEICEGYEYGFGKLMEIPQVGKCVEEIHNGFKELGKCPVIASTIEGADALCSQVHDSVFNALYGLFGLKKPQDPKTK